MMYQIDFMTQRHVVDVFQHSVLADDCSKCSIRKFCKKYRKSLNREFNWDCADIVAHWLTHEVEPNIIRSELEEFWLEPDTMPYECVEMAIKTTRIEDEIKEIAYSQTFGHIRPVDIAYRIYSSLLQEMNDSEDDDE